MKKLFFTLLLISTASFGQILKPEDFKKIENRMGAYDLKRQIANGENKLSDVIIGVGMPEEVFKKISLSDIEKMISLSNEKSMLAAKNKYTYVARVIKISATNEKWHCTIEYTAQNDYGAVREGLNSADFSLDGNLISFQTILK